MNEFPKHTPLVIISNKAKGCIVEHFFPIGLLVEIVAQSNDGMCICSPLEHYYCPRQHVPVGCLSLPNFPAGIKARLSKVGG